MNTKKMIFLFFIVGLIFFSCIRDFSEGPISSETRPLTNLEKKLVETDEKFGLKLFRELNKYEGNKKIFISPLSVNMALAMAYNGAVGTTEQAMRKTLEFGNLTQNEINESYKSLIGLLSEIDPKVQFQMANSIWFQQGFNVLPDFININKTYFDAEVRELDLHAPGALEIINGWVSTKTNSKVNDIIKRIDPLTIMFLINAIYFNGMWTYEFDKNQTFDDKFYLENGNSVDSKMMQQHRDFYYYENENLQAIDLEYGDGKYSMTIFLPKSNISINSLITQLDASNFTHWIGNFTESEGTLLLPKFKMEYRILLKEILTTLGMGIAFDQNLADFSKMCNSVKGNLYIDRVIHQTFVEVDEEGTEAAAATVVVVNYKGAGPKGFVMHVNRPFLFVIRERQNNVILFMGKVVEPTF